MNKRLLVVGFASLSLFAAAQSQSNEKKDATKATHEVKSPRDAASGQASGRSANSAPGKEGVIHRDLAARDASSGMATGKTSAQDDWDHQSAASGAPKVQNVSASDTDAARSKSGYNVKNQTKARVAAGDVNGDGVDASAGSNPDGSAQNAAAVRPGYNVKSQTKARVAAGDMDGDGSAASAGTNADGSTQDASGAAQSDVKSPRDSSTGMATGKRQHKPILLKKASDQTPNK